MKRVNIGSDKGLSPIRPQVFILTNTQSLSVGPLWTNVFEIVVKKSKFLIQESTFENCEMAAILSSGELRTNLWNI